MLLLRPLFSVFVWFVFKRNDVIYTETSCERKVPSIYTHGHYLKITLCFPLCQYKSCSIIQRYGKWNIHHSAKEVHETKTCVWLKPVTCISVKWLQWQLWPHNTSHGMNDARLVMRSCYWRDKCKLLSHCDNWCQKQVSQAGINNCIPQNYLSMLELIFDCILSRWQWMQTRNVQYG